MVLDFFEGLNRGFECFYCLVGVSVLLALLGWAGICLLVLRVFLCVVLVGHAIGFRVNSFCGLWLHVSCCWFLLVVGGVVVGLLVNCIVVASIFFVCLFVLCFVVVFCLCSCLFFGFGLFFVLGRSVDALVLGADEGRGGLRYALGS